MVETAKCGSSWPMSCADMPKFSVVFGLFGCAMAGAANATAEARRAARSSMRSSPSMLGGELAASTIRAMGAGQGSRISVTRSSTVPTSHADAFAKEANVARHEIDALCLIRMHHTPARRPPARTGTSNGQPRAVPRDRRDEGIAGQFIEPPRLRTRAGRSPTCSRPTRGSMHDADEITAIRHVAGARHQMISRPTSGPQSIVSGRFSGLH